MKKSDFDIIKIDYTEKDIKFIEISLKRQDELLSTDKLIEKKVLTFPILKYYSDGSREIMHLELENLKSLLRNDLNIYNKFVEPFGRKGFFVLTNLRFLDRVKRLSKKFNIKDEEYFLSKIVEFSLEKGFEQSVDYSLGILKDENKLSKEALKEVYQISSNSEE